jgi:glutathionylspermidine synthase
MILPWYGPDLSLKKSTRPWLEPMWNELLNDKWFLPGLLQKLHAHRETVQARSRAEMSDSVLRVRDFIANRRKGSRETQRRGCRASIG